MYKFSWLNFSSNHVSIMTYTLGSKPPQYVVYVELEVAHRSTIGMLGIWAVRKRYGIQWGMYIIQWVWWYFYCMICKACSTFIWCWTFFWFCNLWSLFVEKERDCREWCCAGPSRSVVSVGEAHSCSIKSKCQGCYANHTSLVVWSIVQPANESLGCGLRCVAWPAVCIIAGENICLLKYSDNGISFPYKDRLSLVNLGHQGAVFTAKPRLRDQPSTAGALTGTAGTSRAASGSQAADDSSILSASETQCIYAKFGQGTWKSLISLAYQAVILAKHISTRDSNSGNNSSASRSRPPVTLVPSVERHIMITGQVMHNKQNVQHVSPLIVLNLVLFAQELVPLSLLVHQVEHVKFHPQILLVGTLEFSSASYTV